ncbi:hypothetical protein NW761_010078 [Fusarium oxysporum]|nr:hypothetical protein NW753_012979 [Fusarium oxysporum]KAJ4041089.1 hypothetical protein NW758_007983 [Fusarium oxysporum]KAJ4064188.1 hypothetical protein NW763_004469 [Fusarium oxysporum]KAJ4078560.1 hypothetical protein NW756_011676 [Fusarium oxysporum]KAJ4082579.1 hypothetical protein NW761_010078 [Fusarium oxysporum]
MLPLICSRMQESELKGLGDQRQTNKGGFTRITSTAALVQSNAPRELKLDGCLHIHEIIKRNHRYDETSMLARQANPSLRQPDESLSYSFRPKRTLLGALWAAEALQGRRKK